MANRHVNSSELRYYLKRDFVLISKQVGGPFDASVLEPGDVLVFDGDEHAACYVGNGQVFDRPSWQAQYAYRVVDLNAAHTGMLPPVGGDPHDAIMAKHKNVKPFNSMEIHRPAAMPLTQVTDSRALPWKQFMRLANKVFKDRFEARENRHALISLFSMAVVQDALKDLAAIVELSMTQVAPFSVDPEFEELYFELRSRLDGYNGFVTQYYFSSVHMTYEKFYKQNEFTLKPSESRAEDLELLRLLYSARQLSTDDDSLTQIIRAAASRYPRIHSIL
jgi:hypothetical protein